MTQYAEVEITDGTNARKHRLKLNEAQASGFRVALEVAAKAKAEVYAADGEEWKAGSEPRMPGLLKVTHGEGDELWFPPWSILSVKLHTTKPRGWR